MWYSDYRIKKKNEFRFIFWDMKTKAIPLCISLTGWSGYASIHQKDTVVSFYPKDPSVCHYIKKIQMSVPSSMTNNSETRKKNDFRFIFCYHGRSVIIIYWHRKGWIDEKDTMNNNITEILKYVPWALCGRMLQLHLSIETEIAPAEKPSTILYFLLATCLMYLFFCFFLLFLLYCSI